MERWTQATTWARPKLKEMEMKMSAYERVAMPALGYTVVGGFLALIWKGWPMRMAWQLAKGESPVGPPMWLGVSSEVIEMRGG